jgi:hypothetical protein
MTDLVKPEQLERLRWFKSKRSGANNGCVEAAFAEEGVYLRDSKAGGGGPMLLFTNDEWANFTDGVKDGEFDK